MEGEVDGQAISLGVDDVPEMLGLVAQTQPGPFLRRTVELGRYLGLRGDNGDLVAMAGCRLNPAGWREISAVCTDASQRGNGLAGRLVRAVSALIRAEGIFPFSMSLRQIKMQSVSMKLWGFEFVAAEVFHS